MEEESLRREEDSLKSELEKLQNYHREMVPGFNTNTSNPFPMITELQRKISDYIKMTCQDIFFDVLQPEFTMDSLVKFYQMVLKTLNNKINDYFLPLETQIQKTVVIDGKLFEPIDIVLRKTYQTNYIQISNHIEANYINYDTFFEDIQNEFDIDDDTTIIEFLKSSFSVVYMCYICDPKIYIDINQIGKSVKYNNTTHEALDGFIKQEQNCTIILPAFYRGYPFSKDNIIVKSQVLADDYFNN